MTWKDTGAETRSPVLFAPARHGASPSPPAPDRLPYIVPSPFCAECSPHAQPEASDRPCYAQPECTHRSGEAVSRVEREREAGRVARGAVLASRDRRRGG